MSGGGSLCQMVQLHYAGLREVPMQRGGPSAAETRPCAAQSRPLCREEAPVPRGGPRCRKKFCAERIGEALCQEEAAVPRGGPLCW